MSSVPVATLTSNLFNDGFKGFLQSGDFSDLTIVTKEREYRVHRLLVTYASEYFEQKLQQLPESDEPTRLILEGPFTQEFSLVLQYMYEGHVEFTPQNAIPLLAMANYYLIKPLKKLASDYIIANITRDSALAMLQKAIESDAEEVVTKCLHVIAKNFNWIATSSPSSSSSSSSSSSPSFSSSSSSSALHFLPVHLLIRLTRSDNLAVASEFTVYQVVSDYVRARKVSLRDQDIVTIFETVRFPFLSFEQLKEVESNVDVPRHLLTEALMERLKKHEGQAPQQLSHRQSTSLPSPTNSYLVNNNNIPADDEKDDKIQQQQESKALYLSRLAPRAAYAISLEFTHDFDDKGVFYYVGTKGGSEPWSNPAIRGRVRVSSSSTEKGNVTNILERTPNEFWTMDVPASWIQVSLGSTRTLVPNYYTLRHGGNSKADALRNWMLQGSNDGKNWVVLRRHTNDTALNATFATASWSIDCTQSFRTFRVLQNGHNSSNNNFLSVCGIELYGDLYEKDVMDGYVSP